MACYASWKISIAFMFLSGCNTSKLLLILMDGFRWDYFFQPGLQLPGFQRMFQEGVRAEYIIPDFPSSSYPNYYSLMTGLHAESHGFVSNFMYSTEYNQTFWFGTNPEQYHAHWWDDAEPVWVTAENHNTRSFLFHWPGCEVTIRGVDSTFCQTYTLSLIPEFQFSINSTLQLLENDDADLIGIYLEGVDRYGHDYGAKSNKLNRLLKDVDTELNYLLEKLSSGGLDSDLNIMIFSDHGMANVTAVVDLRNSFNFDDIEFFIAEITLIDIWPKDGKVEKVYNDLIALQKSNITIYKKEDIPERYHYRNHKLIPPIIIVPDVGFTMCTDKNPETCSKEVPRGYHGYDNLEEDMRAMFVAKGPAFKKNYVAKPMANVQLYQIMCSILGIPAQPHNGTWEVVADMMAPKSRAWLYFNMFLYLITFLSLVVLVITFRKQFRTVKTKKIV